jgi:hypothetical protein
MMVMKRRQIDSRQRRLLVCSLVIAVGLVMVILGFQSSVTGKKALALPPTIEDIDPVPVPSACRPRQRSSSTSLGYTGVLVIDGIELNRRSERPDDPNAPARQPLASGDAAGNHDLRGGTQR